MATRILQTALLIACSAATLTSAAIQRLDGIVAVIGDSAILYSELEAFTLYQLNKQGVKPDSVRVDTLQKEFLDELIDRKVLLVHASKDSTVRIKDDEVEDMLNRQVRGILQKNNLSMDDLEAEVQKSYGMSMVQFKAQLRATIRENLLIQKIQQQYISAERISRKDVESFYAMYKDSLPTAGKCVRLSKLSIRVAPSDSVRQKAYRKMRTIKQRLDNGEDFAALAKQFSDDPNAGNGGDLGLVGKGTLDELTFEQKAFSLEPGQTSDIFETRLGFHIIKVEERKDQMVHVRQILAIVAPREQEIRQVTAVLDSIRAQSATREHFTAAVQKFCTDAGVKSRNGDIGWQSVYDIPQEIRALMDSAAVGTISPPLQEGVDYVIFRLDDRVDDRRYTLKDDYDMLAEKAKDIYAQKKLIELVKKWRANVFVDIRL
jgi:peptidyl-prolyl cis-trans isomerase SurA